MSRQLRISDETHEMLTLLKPHPSASYDDVIRDLVGDVCPYLQDAIDNLKLLEKENPRQAAGERILLQQRVFEDVVVDRMLREREHNEERQIDEHLKSMKTAEEINQDKEWETLNERRRQLLRQRILLEKEGTKKNAD